MIAKFETSSGAQSKSGSGNGLLYLGIAIVGGFLLWRYVVKPYMDKNKAEKEAK